MAAINLKNFVVFALLFLTSCSSNDKHEEQKIFIIENIWRQKEENLFSFEPLYLVPRPTYPWEKGKKPSLDKNNQKVGK